MSAPVIPCPLLHTPRKCGGQLIRSEDRDGYVCGTCRCSFSTAEVERFRSIEARRRVAS